jgi:hypothetical protein
MVPASLPDVPKPPVPEPTRVKPLLIVGIPAVLYLPVTQTMIRSPAAWIGRLTVLAVATAGMVCVVATRETGPGGGVPAVCTTRVPPFQSLPPPPLIPKLKVPATFHDHELTATVYWPETRVATWLVPSFGNIAEEEAPALQSASPWKT